jgi:V/A-type H+-transporting ATPase subunit I
LIEKMKFLTITGPKSEFDRIVNVYLTKYDIHLENALAELSTVRSLRPFVEANPYRELIERSEELTNLLDPKAPTGDTIIPADKASDIINSNFLKLQDFNAKRKELFVRRDELEDLKRQIEPFRSLEFDLNKLMNFKFIKFRFGKVAHEYYNKFIKYVYDNSDTYFFECDRDREYVWGVYFAPSAEAVRIDAIYSSLHFERIFLSDSYEGTPVNAYQSILTESMKVKEALSKISAQMKQAVNENAEDILLAKRTLSLFTKNFDVRKLAAITKGKGNDEVFFILCGWIEDKYSEAFLEDMKQEKGLYCTMEEGQESPITKPPTKLKNPKLFKPFEMFLQMYGLPAYDEVDPTSFVAITYSLIFGIMFGDVGQGLVLAIGGALLYKLKKMNLAAIVAMAGVFSTLFGFVYGSIFGFEDVLTPLWLSPMANVMTVLLTAVGFGVALIIIAMIINIINGIKAKEYGKVFFDTNGIPGLVFYSAAVTCVLLASTGHTLPAAIVLVIFFGIPLLLIFFKEPLTHWVEKNPHIFPEKKGMFFVESFFELFEVLLSYVTNTISFLRVGAFALSHAAMMGVVMLLAGVKSGSPNIAVLVIGNLFVAGMEGLIVAIQVLRLEYYEMFSRFYKGTGKEFKPYK